MLYNKYKSIENKIFQIMDKDGKILDEKLMPKLSKEQLLKVYEVMMKSRQYDFWMLKWQRQGRTYGFLESSGQEALQVACAMHLEKGKDWLAPAFRSNAAWIWLGFSMKQSMIYWSGNEIGSVMEEGVNVLPVSIPIATQSSHAAGLAFAEKYKKTGGVVLSFIGDGGTSEGEFSEALNFSGVLQLPTIFVIQNNQWALSTPNKFETNAANFALKGVGAGVKNIVVDGNDFFAVYQAMSEAITFARNNEPYLIECITYRIGDHSTSDDSSVYRTPQYVAEKMKLDPIQRLRKYLIKNKILTEKADKEITKNNEKEIKEDFKIASISKNNVSIDDIFDHTYLNIQDDLIKQKKVLTNELTKSEDLMKGLEDDQSK